MYKTRSELLKIEFNFKLTKRTVILKRFEKKKISKIQVNQPFYMVVKIRFVVVNRDFRELSESYLSEFKGIYPTRGLVVN